MSISRSIRYLCVLSLTLALLSFGCNKEGLDSGVETDVGPGDEIAGQADLPDDSTTDPGTGGPGPQATPGVAPPPPENIKLKPMAAAMELSWDPVGGVAFYNIYWSYDQGVSKQSDKIEKVQDFYVQKQLHEGTRYYYAISSVNADGEGELSDEVTAVTEIAVKGVVDDSFGTNGLFDLKTPPLDKARGYAIAVDADGRIIGVNNPAYKNSNGDRIALWRLLDVGKFDSAFGLDGEASISPTCWGLQAVALDGAGRILVAGDCSTSSGWDGTVTAYDSEGNIDKNFGDGGVASAKIHGNDYAYDMAIDGKGRIVIAGYADTKIPGGGTQKDVCVARFNSDGTVDTSFGNGKGYVIRKVFKLSMPLQDDYDDVARAIAIDENNGIVLTGYTVVPQSPLGEEIFLMKMSEDGSVDTSFAGGKGSFIYDLKQLAEGDDRGYGIAIDDQRRIIVVGKLDRPISPQGSRMFLMRFDPQGVAEQQVILQQAAGYVSEGYAVRIDSDGRIVVAGSLTEMNWLAAVWRYLPDMTLDMGFGSSGAAIMSGNAQGMNLAFDNIGRILMTGYVYTSSNEPSVAVWRIK